MVRSSEMTGSRVYARLVALRDKAGATHYERIKLADQLLKDREWVQSASGGGGDEGRALDRLEADCFGDVCGLVSLPQLLEVFHHVPDVTAWRAAKFNLKKVWAAYQASRRPEPRDGRRNNGGPRVPAGFVDPTEFPELTESKKQQEYGRVLSARARLEAQVARLEADNARLREENRALKARLDAVGQAYKSA